MCDSDEHSIKLVELNWARFVRMKRAQPQLTNGLRIHCVLGIERFSINHFRLIYYVWSSPISKTRRSKRMKCVCVKWINCIWRLASSNTRTKPTQLYTYNDSRNVVRRRRQRHFLLHQRPGTSDGHLRQATWATFWQIKKKRKKYLENISNSPWTMNAHYIWWNKWNETKLEPIGKIRRQINEDWVERKREIKIAQWKVENGYDIEKRTE